MKTRKFGSLEVLEMGFGCMSISANYGSAAEALRSFVRPTKKASRSLIQPKFTAHIHYRAPATAYPDRSLTDGITPA
jgi:aryl-alcohol dehydrogenase-like predicted oxidoreductase